MAEYVARPPIRLGPVAPAVLAALFAREFEGGARPAGAAPAPTTAADTTTHVMLVLERALGAFMHVPSDTGDARVALGRFDPAAPRRTDRVNRLITGPALDLMLDGKVSSLRAGYNVWLGTDSVSRAAEWRDLGAPYVGAALLASKLRVSVGPRPRSLREARPTGWIGEVGLTDLNGILYRARQGARGARMPLRDEPTDAFGCTADAPGPARRLDPGASRTVPVRAGDRSNPTGVVVDSGGVHRIVAAGSWKDGRVRPSTSDGFRTTAVPFHGVPVMVAGQHFKRERGAPCFELVGELPAGSGQHVRFPTAGHGWTAPRGGALATFANDAPFTYGNDRGCLTLTVTRVR